MCVVCGDPDCCDCCEVKEFLGCDYCQKEGCADRECGYQPDPSKRSI